MKNSDIKTPQELLKFMDEHIQYGFIGNDKKVHLEENEDFASECQTKWKLSTPLELLDRGYGTCWDQVELERSWFLEHGYKIKTLFIWFELDHENPYTIHTFLIFEEDGKYCIFENADSNNRGINKFDTYKDAIYYQIENHLRTNNRIAQMGKDIIECLHIYEYDQPTYGSGMFEFMDFILDEGIKIL